jgi:hypothetical protein
MSKWASTGILTMFLSLLLICPPALAGPKGQGQGPEAGFQEQRHSGLPAGFSKGQKQGWQGSAVPRGWTNPKGQKKGWRGGCVPKGIGKKQPIATVR